MKLPTRYNLRVPTSTIFLTLFSFFSLSGLMLRLYQLDFANTPNYIFFVLSFAGLYIALNMFKIIWWNVLHRGWLEVSSEEIVYKTFFRPILLKTEDISEIDIPEFDGPTTDGAINITTISNLQGFTAQYKLIIPLIFFPDEAASLLPLVLSSVTK